MAPGDHLANDALFITFLADKLKNGSKEFKKYFKYVVLLKKIKISIFEIQSLMVGFMKSAKNGVKLDIDTICDGIFSGTVSTNFLETFLELCFLGYPLYFRMDLQVYSPLNMSYYFDGSIWQRGIASKTILLSNNKIQFLDTNFYDKFKAFLLSEFPKEVREGILNFNGSTKDINWYNTNMNNNLFIENLKLAVKYLKEHRNNLNDLMLFYSLGDDIRYFIGNMNYEGNLGNKQRKGYWIYFDGIPDKANIYENNIRPLYEMNLNNKKSFYTTIITLVENYNKLIDQLFQKDTDMNKLIQFSFNPNDKVEDLLLGKITDLNGIANYNTFYASIWENFNPRIIYSNLPCPIDPRNC
jgi:hypothetical protein